ncbi:unnamed protein product [Arabis nemorensis]|uniref:Uncharacterized protein n=1 Tax=Arabis nemorensis TaxID=586526 RepID=A0A565C4D9_9BRAS|nr:unnamed protein product [Arabis nemorensis]
MMKILFELCVGRDPYANGQSSFIPPLTDNGLSLSFSPLREHCKSSSIPPLTENGQSPSFPPLTENGQSSPFPPLMEKGKSSSFPPLPDKFSGQSSSFPPLPDKFSGQSSSFPPTVGVVKRVPHDVADVASLIDADMAVVAAPFGVCDHIQYQNTNMNHSQQGPIQQYGIHDMKPNQNMHTIMHHNRYEPVYYQDPVCFNDQIKHGNHNMNPNLLLLPPTTNRSSCHHKSHVFNHHRIQQ